MTLVKHSYGAGYKATMRSRILKRLCVPLLAVTGLFIGNALHAAATAEPMHIVSLNPCIDIILVELVPRARIAAISHYSLDPYRSTIAALARTLPVTYETAEEVVALKPDLVLAGRHSAIATRNALRRVGIRFELFDVPESVAASLEQIRRIAALLGRRQQGELLIARIERSLHAARPAADYAPFTAIIYEPGGLTAGSATVTNELMTIVGLRNAALRHGVRTHRPLSLELLVSAPPQILLVGETSTGAPTQAERVVQHRVLRALQTRMRREIFPARLLYCAGPAMIEAVDTLVTARDNAQRSLVAQAIR